MREHSVSKVIYLLAGRADQYTDYSSRLADLPSGIGFHSTLPRRFTGIEPECLPGPRAEPDGFE